MKKLVLFLFLPLLLSCSEERLEDLGFEVAHTSYEVLEIDSVKVNADEVRNIVESVFPQTKSSNGEYSVETIYDDNQEPLVYVVNRPQNGGFMIISATKNYDPILAYNTTGHFSVGGEKPDGLKMWQEGTLNAVNASDTFRQDVKHNYRRLWRQYEDGTMANAKISRSPDILTPEESQALNKLRQVVEKKKGELRGQGYHVYSVDDRITGDEAFDDKMREYIKEAIHPEYADYWYALSFIANKPGPDRTEFIDNFLSTKWGQNYPFNMSFPMVNGGRALVGCGSVALGQVLRYFEYPKTFNWSAMPNESATKTTSDFLYDVAKRSKAQFGGNGTSTYFSDTYQALLSYGYTATLGVYGKVYPAADLSEKRPVIMRGTATGNNQGHAWVCSGYDYVYYDSEEYEIWTYIRRTEFGQMYKFMHGHPLSSTLVYMNWGWNGTYDGFYYYNSLKDQITGTPYNDMKLIINITPNRR